MARSPKKNEVPVIVLPTAAAPPTVPVLTVVPAVPALPPLDGETGAVLSAALAGMNDAVGKQLRQSNATEMREKTGKVYVAFAAHFAAHPEFTIEQAMAHWYGGNLPKNATTLTSRKADWNALRDAAIAAPERMTMELWNAAKNRDRFLLWCRKLREDKTISTDTLVKDVKVTAPPPPPQTAGDLMLTALNALGDMSRQFPADFAGIAKSTMVIHAAFMTGKFPTTEQLKAAAKVLAASAVKIETVETAEPEIDQAAAA